MSSLQDTFNAFFQPNKHECLYCHQTDGELKVAVRMSGEATHWIHEQCEQKMQQEEADAAAAAQDRLAFGDWFDKNQQ